MRFIDFYRRLIADDETQQKFTRREIVKYGIVYPIMLVVIMGIAGWIETSCV